MTEHAKPEGTRKPDRAQIEEIRSLRSRLARFERSEVKHGQTDDVYRSLIASLPQGLLIVQEGQIVLANEAMADLTGYSIDEMKAATPQQVQAFVHPEDRALVWGRYRDRLTGKPAPKHYEFRGIRKDGNTCWLEVYVGAIEYGGKHAVQAVFTDITERKKVELGLRQSNDLLRAIIEAAPTAIIGLDLDGNVHTVWNQAAEKMLGWTAQEAMGRPLPSVPVAGQEEFRGFREQIRRGLTLDGVEVRRQRKDGTPIDYSIYASPLHDVDGRIAGNVAVLVDITERKRMEAALRDSERKLEEAQRIAHVGHWEHDLDAGTITGSDETLRVFGVAPRERTLSFARFSELVHPEDKERVAQKVAEALRDCEPFDLEYRVVRPAGEVRFVYVQCNVTREESGRPRRLFGIVQDITERRQAVEALRRSEEKYHTIVDTATEGIWLLGPDTRTTFANARMTEMLGVSYEETIGRALTDFMYEEDIPDHVRKMQNRRDGVSENYERRFRRKDGRTVWTLVSATPVFDDEHRFQGSFGMFTDITDRRRAEEELRRSESRYRIVADNTYDWEFWIGPDGRFLYSSPSCHRITGHTADDFRRDPGLLNRLVHPDDRECFSLHCSHVMEERTPGEIEYRIVLADGSVRHIGHVCQPVFDERGEYLGMRGSDRDITKRKQVEQDIVLLSFALNNVREAAFLIDEDASFHFVNEEACRVLGYTREELLGLGTPDVDPDFPMERWPGHWNDLKMRRSLTFESRHRAKDGRTFPVEINANYVEYEGRSYDLALVRDITERRRTENELISAHKQRERLLLFNEALLSAIPTPVFYKDQEGRYLGCNRAFSEIMGVTAEEMKGRTVYELWPEEHAREYHRKDLELVANPTRQTYEFRVLDKNGVVRPVIYAKDVFRDENGQPAGIVGAFLDITDRTQAEEALRESEQRFRDLYENAPNAYFSIGVDGRIRRCNRRAGGLLGYAAEELVGRPVTELYADTVHGKEKAKHVLRRFQAGETVGDQELEMQKVDGNRVWISLTVDAVRDAQGQIIESRSMVVDITERKRAESIRNARLHLLQFATTHSLDELLQATLDELETFTESQIGFYHFLEADQRTLSLQTWSTRTLRDMCTAEGKGRHYSVSEAGVWVDCIRERRPVIHNDYASLPHRKGMPPGHAPVIRELVVPVFRGDQIVAILGVGNKPRDYAEGDVEIVSNLADLAWDIAERKRAEMQAENRRAELLHVSRLNTLGEMASGLAHELSQPLSAILNFASAGVRRVTSGGADVNGIARSLEKIADQAKRAGNILGRIRALAQRRPPQFASVDMNEVVKDVVDLISWEARRQEVGIKLELADGLPSIRADTTQMEQVVLNLARNAIEAMGAVAQRPRLLTIRTRTRGDALVQIEVRDTGVGLPEDSVSRIFEPFFTTKANGLGVGLSISRTIVEMHNGTLEAKRNADCGSTFVLALPVAQSETP
ncbi:MAG: PAS domain S-box protein [Phycisphaerales bacterium]